VVVAVAFSSSADPRQILETEVARSPTRRVIQVDDEEEDVKAEDEGAA
jgi:hypothetical protein